MPAQPTPATRIQRRTVPMNALEVRGLSVEAGGMTVVRDLELSVASGDKVGVVGRNGAGKTSTLRVLAGEMPPASGTVERRGALGYLRQDPRQHRDDDATSGIEYLLGARGLVELQRGVEKARLRLEEHASEDRVSRFTRLRGGVRAARRVPGRVRCADDRRRARALPGPARPAGRSALGRRASSARAGADPVRRLRPPPVGRADEPPRRRREGLADAVPRGLPRGAPRRQPRHRAPRRLDHADPASGSGRGRRVPRHVLAVPRGEGPRREAAHGPRLPPGDRDPAAEDPGRLDAGADREACSQGEDARHAGGATAGAEGRCAHPRARRPVPVPGAAALGPRRCSPSRGSTKGYGGPAVFDDVSFDVERGERLLVMGLNGAGKTSLLRILAGETRSDAGSFRLGHGVQLGYYAQEHEGIRDGMAVLTHMHQASRADDQSLRSLLGMFGLPGDVRVPGCGHAVRRGEDEARARPARRRAEEPAAPRRADQQPRSAVTDGDRPGAPGLAGRDGDREPRHRVRRSPYPGTCPVDAGRRPRLLERGSPRPRRARLTAMLRR